MSVLLSFGHGYVAQALGRHLLAEGWRVIGTSRDPERVRRFAAEGVEGLAWPEADIAGALAAATHVLVSVPPEGDGDPVLRACGAALGAAAGGIAWFGYLSTTGVYGDHRGGWVDETTPPAPTTPRGRRRLAAEEGWRALAASSGLPLHIFRLAGIYGPGRTPFARLRAGTARRIVKPGQVFNRIHVADIVAVLAASIARPDPGAVYNLADDDPSPPEVALAEAARLAGLPLPPAEPFDGAAMSEAAAAFYADSKRVRNDRIKQDLGVRLRYPDHASGLRALLAAEAEGAAKGQSPA